MVVEATDGINRVERKRLSAFGSLLLIGGISIALWSAIISIIVHIS
ncbi:MAG TPA: hypothetical protein VME41_10675 [Stellaceae bacterium]|nr:hypothetical protein [Stellaceae bacterium]